ncbi:MAG: class I SAM-dependent methyltransferase [Planctomycetota bacterium]
MRNTYRDQAAKYYDAWADFGDIDFYRRQVPKPDAEVLELGCGTGRVLLPTAEHCAFIQGVDHSDAMLELCRAKLHEQSVPTTRAQVRQGDITDLDLDRTFDLITAPFRVMQNLETDAQIDGLLETIRRHLAADGRAILNTFCPRDGREALYAWWSQRDGTTYTEKQTPLGPMRIAEDCRHYQTDPLIMFPVLIYELIEDSRVVDRAELPISMRVWYPDELIERIVGAGFHVIERWGGYDDEPWGEGNELVVAFTHG